MSNSYSSLLNVWPPPSEDTLDRLQRLQELQDLRKERETKLSSEGLQHAATTRIDRRQGLGITRSSISRQSDRSRYSIGRINRDDTRKSYDSEHTSYGGARPKMSGYFANSNESNGFGDSQYRTRAGNQGFYASLSRHNRDRTVSVDSNTSDEQDSTVSQQQTSTYTSNLPRFQDPQGDVTESSEVKESEHNISDDFQHNDEDIEHFKKSLYGSNHNRYQMTSTGRRLTPFKYTDTVSQAFSEIPEISAQESSLSSRSSYSASKPKKIAFDVSDTLKRMDDFFDKGWGVENKTTTTVSTRPARISQTRQEILKSVRETQRNDSDRTNIVQGRHLPVSYTGFVGDSRAYSGSVGDKTRVVDSTSFVGEKSETVPVIGSDSSGENIQTAANSDTLGDKNETVIVADTDGAETQKVVKNETINADKSQTTFRTDGDKIHTTVSTDTDTVDAKVQSIASTDTDAIGDEIQTIASPDIVGDKTQTTSSTDTVDTKVQSVAGTDTDAIGDEIQTIASPDIVGDKTQTTSSTDTVDTKVQSVAGTDTDAIGDEIQTIASADTVGDETQTTSSTDTVDTKVQSVAGTDTDAIGDEIQTIASADTVGDKTQILDNTETVSGVLTSANSVSGHTDITLDKNHTVTEQTQYVQVNTDEHVNEMNNTTAVQSHQLYDIDTPDVITTQEVVVNNSVSNSNRNSEQLTESQSVYLSNGKNAEVGLRENEQFLSSENPDFVSDFTGNEVFSESYMQEDFTNGEIDITSEIPDNVSNDSENYNVSFTRSYSNRTTSSRHASFDQSNDRLSYTKHSYLPTEHMMDDSTYLDSTSGNDWRSNYDNTNHSRRSNLSSYSGTRIAPYSTSLHQNRYSSTSNDSDSYVPQVRENESYSDYGTGDSDKPSSYSYSSMNPSSDSRNKSSFSKIIENRMKNLDNLLKESMPDLPVEKRFSRSVSDVGTRINRRENLGVTNRIPKNTMTTRHSKYTDINITRSGKQYSSEYFNRYLGDSVRHSVVNTSGENETDSLTQTSNLSQNSGVEGSEGVSDTFEEYVDVVNTVDPCVLEVGNVIKIEAPVGDVKIGSAKGDNSEISKESDGMYKSVEVDDDTVLISEMSKVTESESVDTEKPSETKEMSNESSPGAKKMASAKSESPKKKAKKESKNHKTGTEKLETKQGNKDKKGMESKQKGSKQISDKTEKTKATVEETTAVTKATEETSVDGGLGESEDTMSNQTAEETPSTIKRVFNVLVKALDYRGDKSDSANQSEKTDKGPNMEEVSGSDKENKHLGDRGATDDNDGDSFETASEEESVKSESGEKFYEAEQEGNVEKGESEKSSEVNRYIERNESLLTLAGSTKIRRKKINKAALLGAPGKIKPVPAQKINLYQKNQERNSDRFNVLKRNGMDLSNKRLKNESLHSNEKLKTVPNKQLDRHIIEDNRNKSKTAESSLSANKIANKITLASSTKSKKVNMVNMETQTSIKMLSIGVQVEDITAAVQALKEVICPCCKHKINLDQLSPAEIGTEEKVLQKENVEDSFSQIYTELEELTVFSEHSYKSTSTSPKSVLSAASSKSSSPRHSPAMSPRKRSPSPTPKPQRFAKADSKTVAKLRKEKVNDVNKMLYQNGDEVSVHSDKQTNYKTTQSPIPKPRKNKSLERKGKIEDTKSFRKGSPSKSLTETESNKNRADETKSGRKTPIESDKNRSYETRSGRKTPTESDKNRSDETKCGRKTPILFSKSHKDTSSDKKKTDYTSSGRKTPILEGNKSRSSSVESDIKDKQNVENKNLPGYMQPTRSSQRKKSIGSENKIELSTKKDSSDNKGRKSRSVSVSSTDGNETTEDKSIALGQTDSTGNEKETSPHFNKSSSSTRAKSKERKESSQKSSGTWYRKQPLAENKDSKRAKSKSPKKSRAQSIGSSLTDIESMSDLSNCETISMPDLVNIQTSQPLASKTEGKQNKCVKCEEICENTLDTGVNAVKTEETCVNAVKTEETCVNAVKTEETYVNAVKTEETCVNAVKTEETCVNAVKTEETCVNAVKTEETCVNAVKTEETCVNAVKTEETCVNAVKTEETCVNAVKTEETCVNAVKTEETCVNAVKTEETCVNAVKTQETCVGAAKEMASEQHEAEKQTDEPQSKANGPQKPRKQTKQPTKNSLTAGDSDVSDGDNKGKPQVNLSEEEVAGVPVEINQDGDEVAPVRVSLANWDPTKLLKDLYSVKLMPDNVQDISDKFIAMEGLMEKLPMNKKKATLLKTWKRRFFRAKDGWLHYFETSSRDKPSESVQLMGGKVDDLGNRILGIDDGRGRFLMVRCPTDKEYGQWKLALESQTADNVKATYVRPSPSLPPHESKKIVLIDVGSTAVRAGILSKEATLPQLFFPSTISKNKNTGELVVGFDAYKPEVRQNSTMTNPVHPTAKVDKFSIDLDTISVVFKKIFTDLKMDSSQYWVMLSTPQNLADKIRAGLMEILVDMYHVQGVCMVVQSLLALYSYNTVSGIIVDIGERMEILPIFDGCMIDAGVSRQAYGGQKVADSLNSCLDKYKFSTPIDQLLVRFIKEQSCYVAENYKDTKKKCEQDSDSYSTTVYLNNYDLPEGAPVTVTHDYSSFQSPEGFFNTDLWGMDFPCVHKLVFQAIQTCPIDSRKRMYRAIYLSGGVTMLPGFADRLKLELSKLAPPSVVVEVHASPQRYHSAFIGACALANMEQFQQISISAEEWKKNGQKAFKKWQMG